MHDFDIMMNGSTLIRSTLLFDVVNRKQCLLPFHFKCIFPVGLPNKGAFRRMTLIL